MCSDEERVEYFVIGAHAVIFTRSRGSRWKALEKFGAPLQGGTPDSFTDKELIYQVGVEPNRIDVTFGIAGAEFGEGGSARERSAYGDIPIFIISRPQLIQAKRATGRPGIYWMPANRKRRTDRQQF